MKTKHVVTMAMAGILMVSIAQAQFEETDGQQAQKHERHQNRKNNRKSRADRGQRPPMGMMLGKIATNPKVAEKLGISEEQTTAINNAITQYQDQHKSLAQEMKAAVKEQLELLKTETADEGALMTAIEKTGAIRTEIAKLRVKEMLVVKKILSPEQVTKIMAFMKERGNKRKNGGENGKGNRGDKGNRRGNKNKGNNERGNGDWNQENRG